MTHPANLAVPPVELLPCPVCGKPAELLVSPDRSGFVVFCEDSYCAGNCVPEFGTKEEACAAWNDLARRADFRWYKSCCPNCGWSEADEQGFLEHQRNLPQPPRLKRILRRIDSWVKFSDLYLFAVVLLLIRGFDDVLRSQGIESGFTPYDQFMVSASFAVLPVAFRVIYDFLQTYIRNRELKAFFDTTDNITTTPTTQGEHHGSNQRRI